jgi:hypothetical protein
MSVRAGLLVSLSALACAVAPAEASAAQRFAAPDAANHGGACTQSDPCPLAPAVSGAGSGDEVIVEPGSYTITGNLNPHGGVNLHGVAGQPAPVIVGSPALGGDNAVSVSAGSSISHLAIQAQAPDQSALALDGATGDDLVLSATGDAPLDNDNDAPAAAVVTGSPSPGTPSVLRDTVAWTTGTYTNAVSVGASQGNSAAAVDLVNVTAIASGAGSLGVVAYAPQNGSVTSTNVIARGPAGDLYSATVPIAVSYSDFRHAASAGFTDDGNNTEGNPQFVDVAHQDFHEAAGSPTIDAGATVAQSGSSDPDGNPRVLGSAPDMGAYESAAPTTAGDTPTPTPTSGSTTSNTSDQPSTVTSPTTSPLDLPPAPVSPSDPFTGPVLPPPVAGRTVDVAPASGQVLVRVPGAAGFSALSAGQQLPVGSVVDAHSGTVDLTSARDLAGSTQTGRFWGGAFRIDQMHSRSPVTRLTLTGDMSGCRAVAPGVQRHVAVGVAASRPRTRPRARTLWGSDNHGHFSTRGNDSVATVRGTVWMVKDLCHSTVTKVARGHVLVRDLATGHTVLLGPGRRHVARP